MLFLVPPLLGARKSRAATVVAVSDNTVCFPCQVELSLALPLFAVVDADTLSDSSREMRSVLC